MRIGHIVPSLEENRGGPSKSVLALANTQSRLGEDVELLTTGVPPASPAEAGARIMAFPRAWPQRLYRAPGLRRHLLSADFECLHSHALWLLTLRYSHLAARRRGIPLVISPRGMLSSWAYGHHHRRKWLANHLVHPQAFAQASGWHATSKQEAEDIRAQGFTQPVCIAPNGVALPTPGDLAAARAAWAPLLAAAKGRRTVLFYSRFHRKKRVRELIELWSGRPRGDWHLLVAGIPEEYTVSELRALSARLGSDATVTVADSTGLPPPYAAAELFLLPSHSENFGLVVAEALAAGLPALVTDGTPWGDLRAEGAGDCVPWESFGAVLADRLKLAPEELVRQGQAGRAWVARRFNWESSAGTLLEFYRHLRHG